MALQTRTGPTEQDISPAGIHVTAIAWLLAVGSIAFAVVNVVFELNGRFDEGPLADYSAGLTIVNWFVAAVKVAGAAVAIMSVASRPRLSPRVVNSLIWGAAGVLSVYSLGSLAQAIGIAVGVEGTGDRIDPAGIAYVALFLLAAAGFVTLAMSHTTRSRLGFGSVVLGSVGGVLLLAFILVILPMVLSALGVMPSP